MDISSDKYNVHVEKIDGSYQKYGSTTDFGTDEYMFFSERLVHDTEYKLYVQAILKVYSNSDIYWRKERRTNTLSLPFKTPKRMYPEIKGAGGNMSTNLIQKLSLEQYTVKWLSRLCPR